MKYFASFLIAMAIGSPAMAENFRWCSNASGELTFTEWGRFSGIPPYPGEAVYGESWSYKGTKLDDLTRFEKGTTAPWKVLKEGFFEESTNQVLEKIKVFGQEKVAAYAIRVNLERKDGQELIPRTGIKKLTDWVICRRFHPTTFPP
jgi:hypothetical protein